QRPNLKTEGEVVRLTFEDLRLFVGVDLFFAIEDVDHQLSPNCEDLVAILRAEDQALTHQTNGREYLVVVEVIHGAGVGARGRAIIGTFAILSAGLGGAAVSTSLQGVLRWREIDDARVPENEQVLIT